MISRSEGLTHREREVQRHYNLHPVPHHVAPNTLLAKLIAQGAIESQFRVIDVGCGQGVIAELIRDTCGAQVFGVDITPVAASITLQKGISCIIGSNLALPLSSSCGDVIISNGVIHHTPDAQGSFRELARVVKPAGHLYLSLYRRGTSYHFAYYWLGGALRMLRKILGARLSNRVIQMAILPWFYLATFLAIAVFQRRFQPISWASAWDSLNDQLLTPIASFHTKEEILSWASGNGLDCILWELNTATGWMLSFWLRKTTSSNG